MTIDANPDARDIALAIEKLMVGQSVQLHTVINDEVVPMPYMQAIVEKTIGQTVKEFAHMPKVWMTMTCEMPDGNFAVFNIDITRMYHVDDGGKRHG